MIRPEVESTVAELAARLKAKGSQTLNELHDWWVKELGRSAATLKDGQRYMIGNGLATALTLGGAKLMRLAGDEATPAIKAHGGGELQFSASVPAAAAADVEEACRVRTVTLPHPYQGHSFTVAAAGDDVPVRVTVNASSSPDIAPHAEGCSCMDCVLRRSAVASAETEAALAQAKAAAISLDTIPVPFRLVPTGHLADRAADGSGGGGSGFVLATRPIRVGPPTENFPPIEWISTAVAAQLLGMSVIGTRKMVARGLTHKFIDPERPKAGYLFARSHVERLARVRNNDSRSHYTTEQIKATASTLDDIVSVTIAQQLEPASGSWEARVNDYIKREPVRTMEELKARHLEPSDATMAMAEKIGGAMAEQFEDAAPACNITINLAPPAARALERLFASGYFGTTLEACAESFVLAGIRSNLDFIGGDPHGER